MESPNYFERLRAEQGVLVDVDCFETRIQFPRTNSRFFSCAGSGPEDQPQAARSQPGDVLEKRNSKNGRRRIAQARGHVAGRRARNREDAARTSANLAASVARSGTSAPTRAGTNGTVAAFDAARNGWRVGKWRRLQSARADTVIHRSVPLRQAPHPSDHISSRGQQPDGEPVVAEMEFPLRTVGG